MLLTAAHLLRNHDNTRGLGRTTAAGDREQLNKASEEVAADGKAGFLDQDFFGTEQRMGIVEVTSRLDG